MRPKLAALVPKLIFYSIHDFGGSSVFSTSAGLVLFNASL